MIIELPVTNDPAQVFITALAGVKYRFEVKYNDRSGAWTMDIYRVSTGEPLIMGASLVLDTDILDPYYTIPGAIMALDLVTDKIEAGPDDMGSRVKVYWYSDEERPS